MDGGLLHFERAVWDQRKKRAPNRRYLVWENTIILKAKDRDAAYEKAIKLGNRNISEFRNEKTGETGHWEFLGLTSLLPIYEPLEDGAEILWNEHKNKTDKFISSRVKRKTLECF